MPQHEGPLPGRNEASFIGLKRGKSDEGLFGCGGYEGLIQGGFTNVKQLKYW